MVYRSVEPIKRTSVFLWSSSRYLERTGSVPPRLDRLLSGKECSHQYVARIEEQGFKGRKGGPQVTP